MAEMMNFRPDWVSPPGDTIADVLKERGISPDAFAGKVGCSPREIDDLLAGKLSISLAMARKLQSELGSTVEFWISRDFKYRERVAHLSDAEVREWIGDLPLNDMIRFGWLPPVSPSQEFAACLKFFDVPDIATWRTTYAAVQQSAAFRLSPTFESRPAAVAAWLRQGELEAQNIPCKAWNGSRFESVLADVRTLTRQKDPHRFVPELTALCATAGVAVVIVRAPNGCRASGATRFLSDDIAVLQLSFRYLTDDQFWFSFFHEAAHLLLHGPDGFFVEGVEGSATREEQDANDFAEKVLIPVGRREQMLALGANSRDVIRFATQIGIAPGIVVGQLQHYRRLRRNSLNSLKRRFEWND